MNKSEKNILYIQYANPGVYPPLHRSARIFVKRGWKVNFLGISAFKEADNLTIKPDPNINVQKLKYCKPSIYQKFHYIYYLLWVLFWTIWNRPNLIIASDPLSTPVAYVISLLPGSNIIYYEHDSPSPSAEYGLFTRITIWLRRPLSKRSLVCVLPNIERANIFRNQMANNSRVHCVWNCPTVEEVAAPKTTRDRDTFNIIYNGSISPERITPPMIRAISLVPDEVNFLILGYETDITRPYLSELKTLCSELLLNDRISFLSALPHSEMMEFCKDNDAGICILPLNSNDVNVKYMAGASNKVFDYLASGLPILVSTADEWEELIIKKGYGLGCDPDDPESIAAAIRWLHDNRDLTIKMGEQGRQRVIKEWNFEKQFEPVLKIIESNLH